MERSSLMKAKDRPWLALPYNCNQPGKKSTHTFWNFQSISSNKVYHRRLPGVGGQSKAFCGSSAGFLIMFDQNSKEITMIDPLNKAQFQLPPISSIGFDNNIVLKAILSAAPDCYPYDYVVLVIYGKQRELAYYKPRTKTWTKLEEAGRYFDDIIFHKGEFYAVSEYGRVVVFKPGSPNVKEIAPVWLLRGNKVYLMAMEDNLCVVIRFLRDNSNPILGYETYKFDVHMLEGYEEWIHIGKMEDWAIFLGQNESAALSTEDFEGLKGNCIYFTDDNWESYKYGVVGGHDSGVFNMEEECFLPLQCSHHAWQRPVWLLQDNINGSSS